MKGNVFSGTKTLRDSYKIYKESYGKEAIDYNTYSKLIKDFNKEVMRKILLESFEFELPYRLGTIRIKKTKSKFNPKNMKPDWKKTKELGYKVYHMNEHTNFFNFRFYWKKKKAIFKNKTLYSFVAARRNKRELASILKDEFRNIDYYE